MAHYFDITPKKVAPIVGFVALLILLVFGTFSYKAYAYGSTPFFHSVRLFGESLALSTYVTMQHYASGQFAAAALSDKGVPAPEEQPAARAIPVLTYHRITLVDDGTSNVPFNHFVDQMETLHRNGWRTITLSEYEQYMRSEITLPEKSFLLTFDDGAQQSFYPVDPVLRVLNYNAVNYIIVAGSNTKNSSYYLSPAQIHHMLDTGRWEIGSHSFDAHRPYPTNAKSAEGTFYSDLLWLPDENRRETESEFRARVAEDLIHAQASLEQEYDTPIRTFAFPFGGETGVGSVHNYPGGPDVTIAEAEKVYDIGWVQTERKEYTYNYPQDFSFLGQRIHVDHDWDGEKLLQVLENGLPKELPFTDDMQVDRGWLQSWGDVRIGDVLRLHASESESSASTLLDGSRLWRSIDFSTTVNWHTGSMFLLGNARSAKTYRACAFSDGSVSVLEVTDGKRTTLARANNDLISYGDATRLNMTITENAITCSYGDTVVARASIPARTGGIGIQTWDATLGAADATITKVSVHVP